MCLVAFPVVGCRLVEMPAAWMADRWLAGHLMRAVRKGMVGSPESQRRAGRAASAKIRNRANIAGMKSLAPWPTDEIGEIGEMRLVFPEEEA